MFVNNSDTAVKNSNAGTGACGQGTKGNMKSCDGQKNHETMK